MREELKDICFFCKEKIESAQERSLEHIIPNQLLRSEGIQNNTLYGLRDREYSRIKVPAHKQCNNGFGSRYENKVLDILNNPDSLYKDIMDSIGSRDVIGGADDSSVGIISAWLCKIYYGLFYNDYLRDKTLDNDSYYKQIIDDRHFNLIRQSYRDGYAFMLPSTLYAFRTQNEDFDLKTVPIANVIMLKHQTIILVLCIGDGHLTKNYLSGEPLEYFTNLFPSFEKDHPSLPQNMACAEISALRMSIPKTPSFAYCDRQMMNLSMMTSVKNPDKHYRVNEESVASIRAELLLQWGFKLAQA